MRVSHFNREHEQDSFLLYIWGGKWFKHGPTLCVEVRIQYFLDEHILHMILLSISMQSFKTFFGILNFRMFTQKM